MSRIDKFLKELPKVIKLLEDDIDDIFRVAFDNSTIASNSNVFNTSKKLRSSGKLRESFIKDKKVNKDVIYKSNLRYAFVQEKGMFVKSKGKMHKYFWARYFETKKEEFKIIALSVFKKGGVNIKARPYVKQTKKEMQRILNSNEFANLFIGEVVRLWQRTN